MALQGDDYLQSLVQTIEGPLLILSQDYRVQLANSAFYRTFHLHPEQVEGKLLSELGNGNWDKESLSELLALLADTDCLAKDLELTVDFTHLGPRVVLFKTQQLCLKDELHLILLTIEDITKRKQVEEALTASEIRYRRLFEAAQDGILLLDARTGEIVDANPFLQDLLGYSHQEIIGRKLWEMGTFRDMTATREAFEQLQDEKYVRYEDLPLQTKDGRKIDVEFVSNVYAVNGDDIIQCNIRDITQRKQVEEELTISEVRYRRLFEAAQDGILLLDARTGDIVDANPFLQDLLGYSHQEIVGRKLWEIGPFRDVTAARVAFEQLQDEKYVRYEDLPLQTKDGRKIDVEFVSNVYAVNGNDIIQCNIRDITQRKRAEEQLHALHLELEERVAARTAELAQANKNLQNEIVERERAEAREHQVVVEERTRIAREIHDTLAQGLTGIIIQLEAAEDVLLEVPEVARHHVLRARSLARESLAEARRSVWALRPLALGTDDLGYAFLHLVHKLAEGVKIPIRFILQGVLHSLSQDLEHHLLRIGQEALTNALRHAQASEIVVTLTCGEDFIELVVEDDGEGFNHDLESQGMGLQGMQERADSLGGALTINSPPGEGTRVGVRVPLNYDEGGSLDK
jgi:PAS domain S-box-containing protein